MPNESMTSTKARRLSFIVARPPLPRTQQARRDRRSLRCRRCMEPPLYARVLTVSPQQMISGCPSMQCWTRSEIEREVRSLGEWFHNLDLGGVRTAPDHFLG